MLRLQIACHAIMKLVHSSLSQNADTGPVHVCSAGLEAKYKKLYRRAIEVDSDLVYVSVANAALASIPYLIALDHTTRSAHAAIRYNSCVLLPDEMRQAINSLYIYAPAVS